MRSLVARETGLNTDNVDLEVPDDTCPCIRNLPDISISWSRSGPLALAALSLQGRIGVDLERVRPIEFAPMLNMIAVPEEIRMVEAAGSERNRLQCFYRLWSAKEALLKWRGTGLRGGAKSVIVPKAFIAGMVEEIDIEIKELGVSIRTLNGPPGCVAVLAFSG